MKKAVRENLIIIGVIILIAVIGYAMNKLMPCSHVGCKH